MSASEEFGRHKGLDIFPGTVSPIPQIPADGRVHKIPRISWNELIKSDEAVWKKIIPGDLNEVDSAHFVHS